MKRSMVWIVATLLVGTQLFVGTGESAAEDDAEASLAEKPEVVDVSIPDSLPAVGAIGITSPDEPVKYTLGTEDIITIEVRRHPEFSGVYAINSEGKIQYKFVGDIYASGMTKNELKDKLTKILAAYIVEPSIDVTITEYRSKVFYVIGEVGRPGKYYMMADEIPIREAAIQAGLPLLSASANKSKLITPDQNGKPKTAKVDLDRLLNKGDLRQNVMMKPGDVLYVPATLVTKFMRKIAPVAQPVQATAGAEDSFYRIGNNPNNRYR